MAAWLLVMGAALRPAIAAELMIDEVTDLAFDIHVASDTIVFTALGQVFRMPLEGGLAKAISPTELVLDRPRLSPDGQYVIAEGGDRVGRHSLWLMPTSGGSARELTTAHGRHGDADWHPDGDMIVFSSLRAGDHDLWAIRRSDGVEWQLTAMAGDERDPAWEADGSGFLFASNGPNGHVILRLGNDGTLQRLVSRERHVSAPQRRPGGPSVVFLSDNGDGLKTVELLLPIAERAVKPLLRAADIEDERVAWLDRDRLLVARNGRIYERQLAGPRTREIPLTAFISVSAPDPVDAAAPEPVANTDPTDVPATVVLRVERVFDPISGRHQRKRDIRIEGGHVTDIVSRRDWGDALVLEFPDSTVLPGFVDTALRERASVDTARLVGGVTAVAVPSDAEPAEAPEQPAPIRLPVTFSDVRAITGHASRASAIQAARRAGLQVIANRLFPDLRFGVTTLDADALPGDDTPQYADIRGLVRAAGAQVRDAHRVTAVPAVDWRSSRVAIMLAPGASYPPAALGPALDVITRHAGGEPLAPLLRGITADAAAAAGRPDLGQIRVGDVANLVIVPGDPLEAPDVLLDPIALVRAGHLHAVSSLLEAIAQRRDSLQTSDKSASVHRDGDP